jgi:hypothetical protein
MRAIKAHRLPGNVPHRLAYGLSVLAGFLADLHEHRQAIQLIPAESPALTGFEIALPVN